jgi:hypothetical protein
VTDQSQFVDVYSLTTKQKQRVPREWLEDPILGRDFRKTPSQRELDGELPARPAGDAKAKEIEAFADAADIDLTGVKTNADKLVLIEEVFGSAPVQEGLVDATPAEPAEDPLAPEKVAHLDQVGVEISSTSTDQTSTDDTESPDQTPATGNEE